MPRAKMIRSLQDLLDYWSADSVTGLNRRVYKNTACGASISVRTPDGVWHHNGQDWTGITAISGFTLQTIVEGSEATVDSEEFVLPVRVSAVDRWVREMEAEAARLWEAEQDNDF